MPRMSGHINACGDGDTETVLNDYTSLLSQTPPSLPEWPFAAETSTICLVPICADLNSIISTNP